MAVEYAVISGVWTRPDGSALSSGEKIGTVSASTAGGVLVSTDETDLWTRSYRVDVFSGRPVQLPKLPQADVESDGGVWVLTTLPSVTGGESVRYGFELSADCTWAEVLDGAITGIPQGVIAGRLDALEEQTSGYTDHGTVDDDLTLTTLGTHVLDADGPVNVTLPAASDGQMVTLLVLSGAEDVTVLGTPDVASDARPVTFVRVRGQWIVGAGSDATLPIPVVATAPTWVDLSGSDDDAITIPAVTGVTYRIGLDPVAAGTHTLTSLGLDPGAHVTVNAVAESGYVITGATEWERTFSTAADWVTVVTDTFTGADGTLLVGRTTDTGGLTWAQVGSAPGSADQLKLDSNRVRRTMSAAWEDIASLAVPVDSGVRITYDYTLIDSGGGVGWIIPYLQGATPRTFTLALQGDGTIYYYDDGASPPTMTASGLPQSGTAVLTLDGSDLTLEIDGDPAASGVLGSGGVWAGGVRMSIGVRGTVDNLAIATR